MVVLVDLNFPQLQIPQLQYLTSKAANIASATDHTFQYGHFEVIYPKGTEFNVLDKRLEEVELRGGDKYYRWVVEMQEV